MIRYTSGKTAPDTAQPTKQVGGGIENISFQNTNCAFTHFMVNYEGATFILDQQYLDCCEN